MEKNDPAIDEIRAIRHKLSNKLHNEPQKIVDYYITLQTKYRDRLIRFSQPAEMKAKNIAQA